MAASTGSPASRRLTKLTPLTTRPSLTSRQGMMRDLSIAASRGGDQRQRFGGVEPSVIERAAGDGAGEAEAIGLQQALHVLYRGEAARGDDGNRHSLGQRDR